MHKVFYGAQAIALGAYKALKVLQPEIEIECFLVTQMGNNPSFLGGIPVRELEEFVLEKTFEEKDNIEILIGTPENVMEDIERNLEAVGLHHHVRLDSVKWAEMQEKAFIKSGEFKSLSSFSIGSKIPTVEVYKTVHCQDKPLKLGFKFPGYMTTIQVGAALCDKQIAELTDDQGVNISKKNGNYSELTGLYWLWKNRIQSGQLKNDRYFGLAHYRRFLQLSDADQKRIAGNDIDVVLPYPMPYEPNIEVHHERYLTEDEWAGVLEVLEELEPEYAIAFKEKILQQGYLYNYNLVIAKADVLDKYCAWLFKLLFRIEAINNPDGRKKSNRYIGYVGESLETLYFMYNKDKLKIAHTGCRFLV